MDQLTLRKPDDWHLHLRDGAMLDAVVPWTARQFGRAIVMPNLLPPVTTVAQALAYKARILAAVPGGLEFTPLMTAYLTDGTDADELARGFEDGVFAAVKLYPAGATTNSASGLTDISKATAVLERMQKIGMPLLVHGEVTDPAVDIFDREAVFIERVMIPLRKDFPELKVVFEHVTTRQAVDYVSAADAHTAATITVHHLMINRNAIFQGGIRPHMYCLPIAKREEHRQALRQAATSGKPNFFLGTDSAPHPRHTKETGCGCAGLFTAVAAIELYAQVFDEEGALANLEAFASLNGPAFYGLAPNSQTLTLARMAQTVPAHVDLPGGEAIVNFKGGEQIPWSISGAAAVPAD
ncbi:MAG: dihydroorotase [Rhodospirillales bacterium]|nr:dihydroorotase [Rhodospirillales bacterium]